MNATDLDYFVRTRPRLLGIAHRIVGDAHEAEDVLQEVWLRWHRADRATVINADAFLATVTSRLAINLVQSAHRRRETPVAVLPTLEATDHHADPQAQTERGERVAEAARLLLERLPPAQRAAYLLREGFEYPYSQIALILGIGAPHARQLVKRARARVAAGECRPVSPVAHGRLRRAFATAARGGDLRSLEAVLAADLERAA